MTTDSSRLDVCPNRRETARHTGGNEGTIRSGWKISTESLTRGRWHGRLAGAKAERHVKPMQKQCQEPESRHRGMWSVRKASRAVLTPPCSSSVPGFSFCAHSSVRARETPQWLTDPPAGHIAEQQERLPPVAGFVVWGKRFLRHAACRVNLAEILGCDEPPLFLRLSQKLDFGDVFQVSPLAGSP